VFTGLTHGTSLDEETQIGISSLIDVWVFVRDIELGGERNRGMFVPKARGMAHSNQIREFLLTSQGIQLKDVYVGPEGVLTGSMRLAQEARNRAMALTRQQELESRRRDLERKRRILESQIAAQRAEFESEEKELELLLLQDNAAMDELGRDREAMGRSRRADPLADVANRSLAPTGGKGRK
jgi:circadian clock protein KaiC